MAESHYTVTFTAKDLALVRRAIEYQISETEGAADITDLQRVLTNQFRPRTGEQAAK